MFLATIVVLSPNSFNRLRTSAFRISPMLTSSIRRLPWTSRSADATAARSSASSSSTRPSAMITIPSRRPELSRLMMAPTSVSTMSRRLHRRPANSSGMRVSVAPGRLPDPQGQMASLASHRDHEIPARGGLGVDHQVLDDLDAIVAGRLEPERVDVGRQVQVVVDGLRDVDNPDAPPGPLLELQGRIGGVIAADRDELLHVEPEEREKRCSRDVQDRGWGCSARCRCATRPGNGSG